MSVANFFIDLAKRENRSISHILMHKLLYLAQGHSWGAYGRAIMDEAPEAWKYGPVFPSIYKYWLDEEGSKEAFQEFILVYEEHLGTSVFPPLVQESDDIELLTSVWNVYKDKDIDVFVFVDIPNTSEEFNVIALLHQRRKNTGAQMFLIHQNKFLKGLF